MVSNGDAARQERSEPVAGEFGELVRFPALPPDENPEDEIALKRVISGQRAVGEFYSALLAEIQGEVRSLVRLLFRDWERRFGELIVEGIQLLAQSTAVAAEDVEGTGAQPTRADVEPLVRRHATASAAGMLELIEWFSEGSFACGRLVPWKSDARRVYEYFVRCVDAEDQHRGLAAQISELVE